MLRQKFFPINYNLNNTNPDDPEFPSTKRLSPDIYKIMHILVCVNTFSQKSRCRNSQQKK